MIKRGELKAIWHNGIPGLWTQVVDAGCWTPYVERWNLDAGLWTLELNSSKYQKIRDINRENWPEMGYDMRILKIDG